MFRNRRLNEVRTHRRVGDSAATTAAATSANGPQTTTRAVLGQAWPSYQDTNKLPPGREDYHYQLDASGGRRHHTITNLGALAGLKSRLGLSDADTKPLTSVNPVPSYGSSSGGRTGRGYSEFDADNNKFSAGYYANDNNLYGTSSSGRVARDLDRIYATSSSQSHRFSRAYEPNLEEQQRGGYRAQAGVGNNARYSRHTPYTVPFDTRSNPAAAIHRDVPPTLEADPPFVPGPVNTNPAREGADYFRKQSNFNTNAYNGGWNGGSGSSSSVTRGPGNGYYYGSSRRGSGRVIQETDASGSPTRTPVAPAAPAAPPVADDAGYRPLSSRSAWSTIPSIQPHPPAADLRAQEIDPRQQEGDAALDMLKNELNEMRTLLVQLQQRTDSNSAGSSVQQPSQHSTAPWDYEKRITHRRQEPAADTSVTAAEIELPRAQPSSSRGMLATLGNKFRGKSSSKNSDSGSQRAEMITRALNQQQKPQRQGYKVFRMALRLFLYLVLLIAFGKLYVALVELTELKNTPF